MAASKEAIFLALETSIFAFPELPGRWEVLAFPGVRAHATPQASHPIGNLVGVATLTEDHADAVITQVREFFAAREHSVGWWVNPSSTPGDLVSRLEAAGFAKVIELAGQVLTNLGLAIKVNPAVTVPPGDPRGSGCSDPRVRHRLSPPGSAGCRLDRRVAACCGWKTLSGLP